MKNYEKYGKDYYQKNKEIILEKKREKYQSQKNDSYTPQEKLYEKAITHFAQQLINRDIVQWAGNHWEING